MRGQRLIPEESDIPITGVDPGEFCNILLLNKISFFFRLPRRIFARAARRRAAPFVAFGEQGRPCRRDGLSGGH